jgi:hypothetical protein
MPWVVGVWPWGWMSHSLAIVGLKWKRCMCCDCEACLVWVMPWVLYSWWCGLIFLGEPVWVGGLCEVKTMEVSGLWIFVWVVGFV